MKRLVKAVTLVCAVAATTTICAGAMAEGGDVIPRLTERRLTPAPVERAAGLESAEIGKLTEAVPMTKTQAVLRSLLTENTGTEEKSAISDYSGFVKKEDAFAERSIIPEEESIPRTMTLGSAEVFANKDLDAAQRSILAENMSAGTKSEEMDYSGFTKKEDASAERSIIPEEESIPRTMTLGSAEVFANKDTDVAQRGILEENISAGEKDADLLSAELFVKQDADVARAIEAAGEHEVPDPTLRKKLEADADSAFPEKASGMIDRMGFGMDGDIEKMADSVLLPEKEAQDTGRSLTLDSEGIGKLGSEKTLRP